MEANTLESRPGGWIMALLEKIPFLSDVARSYGWHYVISWCHRISGVGLVVYLLIHLYTLSSLRTPEAYNAKMQLMTIPIVVFMAWLSGLPVVFHALNGGRLILYESFGSRNDETLIRWTFGLTVLYAAVFGLLILRGNQSVAPFFFWILFMLAALLAAYAVGARIWRSGHTIYWKLQRITGAFLLVAIPAHLLFSHLNPGVAHEAQAVILRMQSVFIKGIDILLAVSAVYHAGYGLFSIGADYIRSRSMRRLYTAAVVVVFAIFLFTALRLTVTI